MLIIAAASASVVAEAVTSTKDNNNQGIVHEALLTSGQRGARE